MRGVPCESSGTAAAAATTTTKRRRFISAPIGLPADALDGDSLGRQHLVLQGVHGRRGLVDAADEGQRTLKDRLEPLAILDARLRIFVLDDEWRAGDVEIEQLPRGELV